MTSPQRESPAAAQDSVLSVLLNCHTVVDVRSKTRLYTPRQLQALNMKRTSHYRPLCVAQRAWLLRLAPSALAVLALLACGTDDPLGLGHRSKPNLKDAGSPSRRN
jgi:hypothetical protein